MAAIFYCLLTSTYTWERSEAAKRRKKRKKTRHMSVVHLHHICIKIKHSKVKRHRRVFSLSLIFFSRRRRLSHSTIFKTIWSIRKMRTLVGFTLHPRHTHSGGDEVSSFCLSHTALFLSLSFLYNPLMCVKHFNEGYMYVCKRERERSGEKIEFHCRSVWLILSPLSTHSFTCNQLFVWNFVLNIHSQFLLHCKLFNLPRSDSFFCTLIWRIPVFNGNLRFENIEYIFNF